MLSDGNQEDWVERRRNLERAIAALETAKVDPNFYGVVKQDRIEWYQQEVDRLEALCRM